MNDKYEDFKNLLPDYVRNEEDFKHYKLRHTSEHVLNQAIEELWPGKIVRAIGPAIAEGFYNDSRWEIAPSEEDFEKIEAKMQEIIDANLPITRKDVTENEAREMFKENAFKQELITEFVKTGESLTVYYTGDVFVDLCKGPHIDSTGEIKAFKVLNIAGAYWRGDEKNEMLTRVYGTAFFSKEELEKFLWQKEEAKKRDHRKLGQQLDLFTFSELVGPGLPMWTPKGTILRDLLDQYVWELRKAKGYQKVTVPHITKKALYETSGHWTKYAEDLFKLQTRDGEEMALKPMNCPHHTQIFAHKPRSYRDMPQRYAETTMVYRAEQSGELSGLSRVISITQDDAHVFLRKSQIREEINHIWDIVDGLYTTLGMPLEVSLSFRDLNNKDKYLGDDNVWDYAEAEMEEIAKSRNVEYFVARGEAAFYAPKLDFLAEDSIGRKHQVATIQLDLNMPVRFQLHCINEEGQEEQIFMIHAAIMGSIERFLSVLIEHVAGAFPAWLSPVQVKIIPISDQNNAYAEKLEAELGYNGVRVEVDKESERMQNKIRLAQEQKIPYMIIVGKREEADETISLRYRDGEEVKDLKFAEFSEKLLNNIKLRNLDIKLN